MARGRGQGGRTGSVTATAGKTSRKRSGQATRDSELTVVGIGASAGGLTALRSFFGAMPLDTGMAFVVIQHLDPERPSYLVDLLAANTAMPVVLAQDRTVVSANRVYVIAPSDMLTIESLQLRIQRPQPLRGARMQIDKFFRSLAADRSVRSIGVILSGTGTDGTLGSRAIKEEGGLVVVQSPSGAEFDGMPRSAINAGTADLVLPASEIAAALVRYSRQSYLQKQPSSFRDVDPDEDGFADILDLLRKETGSDFGLYKPGTLIRRIQRRMAMRYVATAKQYLAVLKHAPDEIAALHKDLLINVTRFFRDPEAFAFLAESLLPRLIEGKEANSSVRVWVPGSSTGEEAYSIAMLLIEATTAAKKNIKLQVFASDLDEDALATARLGIYPEAIEADVVEARRNRFFAREDHTYKIKAELRESVVFAKHDMLHDPPFSTLDLISCRNVLIYLRQDVQDKLLSLFHFILRPSGILFLGPSETVGAATERFDPVSKKYRIYRRMGAHRPFDAEFPIAVRAPALPHAPASHKAPRPRVAELTQRLLLEKFVPASALVTRRGEGLFYFGHIERYLRVPSGEASQDLVAMAQEGLRPKLRAALREAQRQDAEVAVRGSSVKQGGVAFRVTVTVQPVDTNGEKLLLVSFVESQEPEVRRRGRVRSQVADSTAVEQLEQELSSTREELHGTIRELEAANEELRAANEEAMSVNEELQSVNEEVETSKEELQSLNEELTTLNTELHQRVEEHQQTANNLNNILSSTDMPMLFLDRNFHIRFFTPSVRSLFSIISTDIGRPLSDLTRLVDDPALLDDAKQVLASLLPIEREVRSEAGQWHGRRILAYRTADDRIDGVVVTYTNITDLKVAQLAQETARTYADSIVETALYPLVVVNTDWRIVAASRAFYRLLDLQPNTVIGEPFRAIGMGAFGDETLSQALRQVFATGHPLEQFEAAVSSPTMIGRRVIQFDARITVTPPPGETQTMLVTLTDVTAQQQAKVKQFQSFLDAVPDAMVIVDREHKIAHLNSQAENLFGWNRAELLGKPLDMLMPARFRLNHRDHVRQYFSDPQPRLMSQGAELRGLTKDGREMPIEVSLAPVLTEGGSMVSASVRDITERAAAQEAQAMAQAANEAKSRFLAVASHDLRQPLQTLKFLQGILARKVAEPELIDIVEKAGGTLARMGDALDALLDLSQLESGKIKPSIDSFSVAPVLARLHSEFEHRAFEKGLRFHVVSCTATVRSDARLLEHLVQNLIENAIKYTETGRVLIGCRRRGPNLHIEVWDTGIGIPQEQLHRIFDEFYQLGERQGGRGGGFGLGLSVVQRFAGLLGHRVDVRSTVGKGSMFAVALPLVRKEGAVRSTGVEGSSEWAQGGPVVLLVEDDPLLLGSLRMLVQSEGYCALAATGAAEALDLVRAQKLHPDIVIADYNLPPGQSGIDLAATLRNTVGHDLPVIILTGDTSAPTLKRLADSDCILLRKPASAESLLEALRVATAQHSQANKGARPDAGRPVPSTVAVVDDDRAVREALGSLLEAEGLPVETYSSGEAFLKAFRSDAYGCVLIDIGLPGMDGLALLSSLVRRAPMLSLVMITGRRDKALAVQAMRRGAVDFLEKPVASNVLLASVRAALARGQDSTNSKAASDEPFGRYRALTAREREVMVLITKGMATKEIARDLGLSPRTVEKHRARIMYKMGTDRLADLVRMAVQIETETA